MRSFISHSCPEQSQAVPSEAVSITSSVGSPRCKFDSPAGLILLLPVTMKQGPEQRLFLDRASEDLQRFCCHGLQLPWWGTGKAHFRSLSVALFCYSLLWYSQKKSDSLHRSLSRSHFIWLQKMAFKTNISHSIQNFFPSELCLYRTQVSEEVSNTQNTSQDCLQSSYLES